MKLVKLELNIVEYKKRLSTSFRIENIKMRCNLAENFRL